MLRSNGSPLCPHADLKEMATGFEYLMTSQLSQDCLENVFSQLRGMGGQNQHPDAVETRSRLRILLMAPSPLVAASSSGRAVQLEANGEFLTTETGLENLTNSAFDGLDFQVGLVSVEECKTVSYLMRSKRCFQCYFLSTDGVNAFVVYSKISCKMS